MTDTPKLWRDMTPQEKGQLFLAHHERKEIEVWLVDEWCRLLTLAARQPGSTVNWLDNIAYRIKPEPKKDTVPIYVNYGRLSGFLRIGTVEFIDGKPDPSSIKMEEL